MLASLLFIASAAAETVDFEHASPAAALGLCARTAKAFSDSGYSFEITGALLSNSTLQLCTPASTSSWVSYDGTASLAVYEAGIRMSRIDGQRFSIAAFDVGEFSTSSWLARSVNVNGVTATGSEIPLLTATLDGVRDGVPGGVQDFQTIAVPSEFQQSFTAFTFRPASDLYASFQLDNIVTTLTPVPEPTSGALLVCGLALLAAASPGHRQAATAGCRRCLRRVCGRPSPA